MRKTPSQSLPSRYAVYARVSTAEQEKRGSIVLQLDYADKYCALNDYTAERYIDEDVSGTLPLQDREAGARVLSAAAAKQFDTLLVYRIDRLARDTRILLNIIYELDQHGVTVKSMTEDFDTSTSTGRLLLQILAAISENERAVILDRMWHGANRAARDGRWLGGIVPYGYRVVDKRLVVSDEPLPGCSMSEAEVVRLIYRLSTEEHATTEKISDYLNALGIPPSYVKDARQVTRGKRKVNTAGHWSPGRIGNMLKNTTYTGLHQYGRRAIRLQEVIEREVPAIVTADTWARAQEVLRENFLDATRCQKRQYLLRGLIRCQCGKAYHGTAFSGRQRGVTAYYVCGGKDNTYAPTGEKVSCNAKNLPAEGLEEHVWQECCQFILHPDTVLAALASEGEARRDTVADLAQEREKLDAHLHGIAAQRQSILDLYRKGLIALTDVELQLAKTNAEEAVLRARVKEIQQHAEEDEDRAQLGRDLEERLRAMQGRIADASFEERRDIVRALVREIRVTTEGEGTGRWAKKTARVEIEYRFSKDVSRTRARAATWATARGRASAAGRR